MKKLVSERSEKMVSERGEIEGEREAKGETKVCQRSDLVPVPPRENVPAWLKALDLGRQVLPWSTAACCA